MAFKLWAPTILLSTLLFGCGSVVEAYDCNYRETMDSDLQVGFGLKIVAHACGKSEDHGVISIKVMKNQNVVQVMEADYESSSYALSINTTLDLDLDGVPDLAVATGKGRGGEGMHYWLYDKRQSFFIDLGEAPLLNHLKTGNSKNLFAVISGSGDMQSIRLDYELAQGKISQISALGFVPQEDSSYLLIHLKPDSNGDYTETIKSRIVHEELAHDCMNGLVECF